MPDLLYEYGESEDPEPFTNGNYSIAGLINNYGEEKEYYFTLPVIRKMLK